MELWIRSQDKKELVNIKQLLIDNDTIIKGFLNSGLYYELGEYKTKERALEVLDEIQKLLMPISEYKQEIDNLTINYKNIDTAIYEMPKE